MGSVTFYKYCGHGFGEGRPLEKGQRFGCVKEMEKSVQGYKTLRREIRELRYTIHFLTTVHILVQGDH